MTASVWVLHPQDQVRQDARPVAAMYNDMGTQAADQVVARALGELALTMAGLARQVQAHDLSDVSRQVRRLQRMSEQLGMISLGLVANDVRVCLDRGDATSFSAVWARLMRVAALSLAPDRDLLDQSV
jgi:hypothetical protein